ncbi:MsnO8 family LLM class oxidoreductase [Roseomonas sp. GC11]|uniref:MsnO8 family LLM class oxidoreductase n=1 Tax=Roseomonas sp. GC11 TaxID=2950546 RepID=UPI002108B419|nr:MsnO8 family LLM class oxidoreductase [Roseomonas sp. GC11]MCQ4159075.1 MsnO8 family LLM class oxidoreductase [Roseomonas sp. GC11]
MSYRLSLLDKSPIPAGRQAAEALASTLALAQLAEQRGYHRFWVAEHHGAEGLASVAPEVLAAYLLARTSRIRIGSGGVMLQHYAPYKVAEVFSLLATLAPGRVDLGVGKGPGGLPLSTRALRGDAQGFNERFAELDGFLTGRLPEGHPHAGAVLALRPAEPAQRILLGASADSADLAARHGWQFCYAGHLNGDDAKLRDSFARYRAATGHAPLLALHVLAAPSRAEAERRAADLRVFKVHLPGAPSVNLTSRAGAEAYARQSGATSWRIEETRPSLLTGTPDEIHAALGALHREHGIGEFILDTPVTDFAERRALVESLAEAHQPVPA